MSKPRFFVPTPLQPHQRVELPERTVHYALRVRRLKTGDDVVLFDGRGGEYPAQLECTDKQAIALTAAHDPREAELTGHFVLIQGLPTADKMDWIVEKAVELGASRVIPIAAERSVTKLRGERLEKRLAHWQRIAQSASEQCGRNRIMNVDRPCTVEQFLQQRAPDPTAGTLLCHPDYGVPLEQAITHFADTIQSHDDVPTVSTLSLMIGPEGGWSEAELTLARQHGVNAVQFGPRILRTETAGLALIAASTALLGWNSP